MPLESCSLRLYFLWEHLLVQAWRRSLPFVEKNSEGHRIPVGQLFGGLLRCVNMLTFVQNILGKL